MTRKTIIKTLKVNKTSKKLYVTLYFNRTFPYLFETWCMKQPVIMYLPAFIVCYTKPINIFCDLTIIKFKFHHGLQGTDSQGRHNKEKKSFEKVELILMNLIWNVYCKQSGENEAVVKIISTVKIAMAYCNI